MVTGDKYEFTVRPIIKGNARVTQLKIYVEPPIFKLLTHYFTLISLEKEKGKKMNKPLVTLFIGEINKLIGSYERHEIFSNDSLYFEAIGKFISSNEGWYNTKKVN